MSTSKKSTLRKIHFGLSILASAATLAGIAYLIKESNKPEYTLQHNIFPLLKN